jgi:hypothetical protein
MVGQLFSTLNSAAYSPVTQLFNSVAPTGLPVVGEAIAAIPLDQLPMAAKLLTLLPRI